MRERVMAMTGSLTIQPGYTGKGLVLVARLPCVSSLQPPDGDAGMKVLLVDDHEIVRSGLRNLLAVLSDTQISEAATGRDALLRLRQDRPDLVLLDLNLPGIGGLELLRRMLLEDKTAQILVLSMHAEPLYAARAMELGARGYLSKNASAEELLTAVRRVAGGGRYIENDIAQELALQKVSPGHGLQDLTERDLEIMRLLAEGMSLAEIADAMGIGYKTAANACSRIKAKLGVTRTNDLVRLAMTLGCRLIYGVGGIAVTCAPCNGRGMCFRFPAKARQKVHPPRQATLARLHQRLILGRHGRLLVRILGELRMLDVGIWSRGPGLCRPLPTS